MNEKTLNAGNSEEKRILIDKLVNSGINITPSTLDIILKLDNPLNKISLIIKEMSFLPTFNSHLTEKDLKKISNEKFKKALRRILIREETLPIEKKSGEELNFNANIEKNINEKEILSQNSSVINSHIKKNNYIKAEDHESQTFSYKQDDKTNRIEIRPTGAAKSTLTFNPIAKKYNADYKILSDPTGKLYTSGSYDDFYNLTLDKFNRLYKLMRKRPEALSVVKINNIFRNSQNQYLSATGLVNEIRQTKKGNYFITIEDQTGLLNVIVRKDSENRKIAEKIVKDQMILVEGTYNPGEPGKRGILFADNVLRIDVPVNYETTKSSEPLSIAFISDTHIGSKEFEEKLWKRFINFLSGKIGNNNWREIAGRVKYLIINGDLVDGIGVYPNQQQDLTISDIYLQYEKASEYLSEIPDYIKIFYSSGNHEPVRNAIPRPAVPKKYAEALINIGVKCIGNPAIVKTHDVKTLIYHGDSILDMSLSISDLEQNKPVKIMEEFLKCRHLAPIYGKKTQIAPTNKDWLVIDQIPEIFHTGHVHINGIGYYNNIALVNSGCFQSQTDFMRSFGIQPTPGILSILELDTLKFKGPLDLKKVNK
ncbi:MAG: DNA-directed DNA polymerase II small subunit [Promethearchaeota archaeon]|nr:MAG: DNA-directed DNA polymerase II small subunit [Candidatus Lokiarchaeota archaeon]